MIIGLSSYQPHLLMVKACPILSYILSLPALSSCTLLFSFQCFPVLFYMYSILSFPICPILSNPFLSYTSYLCYAILPYPVLALFHPILYPILSYTIRSCPFHSYPILSCPNGTCGTNILQSYTCYMYSNNWFDTGCRGISDWQGILSVIIDTVWVDHLSHSLVFPSSTSTGGVSRGLQRTAASPGWSHPVCIRHSKGWKQ